MKQLEYIMRLIIDLEQKFEGIHIKLTVYSDHVNIHMRRDMFPFVVSKRYEYAKICDSFPGTIELAIAEDAQSFYMDCIGGKFE